MILPPDGAAIRLWCLGGPVDGKRHVHWAALAVRWLTTGGVHCEHNSSSVITSRAVLLVNRTISVSISLSLSRCRSTAQRSSSVRHPGNETRVVDVYATLLICGITSTHTSWSHLSRVRECDVLLKLSTHKPSRRPSWALSKSHTGTTNDLHLGTHYHAIWRSNCYATTSGERSGFFFNVWMSCIGSAL